MITSETQAYLSRMGILHQRVPASRRRQANLELVRLVQLPTQLRAAGGHATPEQEQAAVRARQAILEQNIPMVVNIASRYLDRGVDLDDLVSEGVLGLSLAVDKFDLQYRSAAAPDGTAFSTYATTWIRQAMWRALQLAPLVDPGPFHHRRTYYATEERMSHLLGYCPTADELAEAVGMTRATITAITTQVQSLDVDGRLEPTQEPEAEPDDPYARNQLLQQLLQQLPDRERFVLQARYGLDRERPLKLRELGELLGITKERARQIAEAARAKLKRLARRTEYSSRSN